MSLSVGSGAGMRAGYYPTQRRGHWMQRMKNIVVGCETPCIQRASAAYSPRHSSTLSRAKGNYHANPQTLPGGGRRRGHAAIRGLLATACGSSHREAPNITRMPTVDSTDFYLFNSYEPGRDGYVTLLANYIPLQAAVRRP